MSNNIPVAKPMLGEEEAAAARDAILSGWVTQGPRVAQFEAAFAEYTGAKHACAVSSCTTALHLGLLAVGVRAGDEVITVSHSFIATANAIGYCGAIPVFADIDPETFNLDPSQLERCLSEKASAILCVHQMGMPCDMQTILEFARQHNLPVVEDAACAIGAEIKTANGWEKVGKCHGDVACFSFHPRKILTTGDGGMLTTNNPKYDKQFRLLRQHGMSIPDTVRHEKSDVVFEEYVTQAFNYRMTDIQAAIGLEQLKKLNAMLERRRLLAERYTAQLAKMSLVVPPISPKWAISNWQSYCVRLHQNIDQKQIMQYMLDNGISTRRGIMCAHLEPAYADMQWRAPVDLNESENAMNHSIILPLYHAMTEEDVDRVVQTLQEAITRSNK